MANDKRVDIETLRNAQNVQQALIAYMIDMGLDKFSITPNAAGRVLLAPDDYGLKVTQDRNGIHVHLIDHAADKNEELAGHYRTPPVAGLYEDSGVQDAIRTYAASPDASDIR